MTAILAFENGRAKHRGLLRCSHRLLALSGASNARHHFCPVLSELNPSVPDYRYFELPKDGDGRRLRRRPAARAWVRRAGGLGAWQPVDRDGRAAHRQGRGGEEPLGRAG